MQSVDSRQQASEGQRRGHNRPQDSSTGAFVPAASTDFLLPTTPGHFCFSAEPASMTDHGAQSGTTGREAVLTSTSDTASSFDTSQYTNPVSLTYPPTNSYMLAQNHNLSPAARSRNGHSASPSRSVDHLSPETGYMSDPSYQDLSTYPTPNYGGHFLNDSFSQLGFADDEPSNSFPQFQGEVDMPLLTDGSLAMYSAQAASMPTYHPYDIQSQLLSPQTNESSPVSVDNAAHGMHTNGLQHGMLNNGVMSTSPQRPMQTQQLTPSKHQQRSPALTVSPVHQPRAAHLASPIVRVENYEEIEMPSPSDMSRPVSKRSHGSRRSANHLSPFPPNESSEDEDGYQQQPVRLQSNMQSQERNEDGSWVLNAESSLAGVGPEARKVMGDVWVPTIEEITEKRLQEEKKLEVHDWLSKSEVGSEAGDVRQSSDLLKPISTRRRAKSTNDAHRRGLITDFDLGLHSSFEQIDDSGIPGPGMYLDEKSDFDDYEDDDDECLEPESPPAAVELNLGQADMEASYFPQIEHGVATAAEVRPWVDDSQQPEDTSTRYQPPTSNAAMMRFRTRAKDVESASLAATVGSRRLSESDLGSIRAAPGVIKAIGPDIKKQKDGQRRPSFLGNILPRRAPSNLLKRKGSIPVQQAPSGLSERPKEIMPDKPKRMGSWGRPKSPRLDTNFSQNNREVGPPSASGLSASSGAWYQGARNAIRRSRSRSELVHSPGLKELMTQHGGPPMPMLASPLADKDATKFSPRAGSVAGEDDEDDIHETIAMDLQVRTDPIIPNHEGFRTHAHQLNPRLPEYMVERITTEQTRRYKRLLEFRVKHLKAVQVRNCGSGTFCPDLGGESKQLPPRAGNRDADAPFIGFQVTAPGSSDDEGEQLAEGTVLAAAFPSGVPLPPVKRLPAEFECPLCFKVKKFYKPSDWTKHVHEDVQPFTCTFPNCGEPKSFKRKADWVRHENERHRQLEHWTCQISDCNHTCYRKDNFVQHLVREHKIAEPRQRTGKAAKDVQGNESDDIWGLVAKCRRDTTKQPRDEPCRFCGNICTTWKKLTVHLAKHMEQISMPILPLVEQKQLHADTIISPMVEMPEGRKLPATPSRSPADNPSRYNPQSTLAPGLDPSFGPFPSELSAGMTSGVMHTYPPPQLLPYKGQQQQQQHPPQSRYAAIVTENPHAFAAGRTYPGLPSSIATRGLATNNLQLPNAQYANPSMMNGQSQYQASQVPMMDQMQSFSNSPVEAGVSDTTDMMGSSYFARESPDVSGGGLVDMGFDNASALSFQRQDAFPDMSSYMPPQQQEYHYQGH